MHIFFSFWWLIFPAMWFASRLGCAILRDLRQRDAMEVVKAYAAQGKTPPGEISRILSGHSPY